MRNIILIPLLLLLLQSCTAEQYYEGARQNRQLECRKLKAAAYEECMQQYQDDYRSYRQKREQVK